MQYDLVVKKAHAMEAQELAGELQTDIEKGLTLDEVKKRLQIFGKNVIAKPPRLRAIKIFLRQFKDVFIIILLIATLIAAFVERDIIDTITILAIVLMCAIVGFWQEYKAEKAIEKLKKLISPKAKVIRNGHIQVIDASELVPGDIILLEEGDYVPADARLIESVFLACDEASLTGESYPVDKIDTKVEEDAPLVERKNMVFAGTHVVRGHGKAIVVATGMRTELGKIAQYLAEVEEEKTPFKEQLEGVAKKIAWATLIIAVVMFLILVIRNVILSPSEHVIFATIIEMFMIAVALAVAVVPEALPAVITFSLATEARRLAKENAIVRRLIAAETLGSCTVICSDKTGTITKGEMTVRYIFVNNKEFSVTGTGWKASGRFFLGPRMVNPIDVKELFQILEFAALCTNAKYEDGNVFGDPTEGALIVAALKAGIRKEESEKKYPRVMEIPFSSERKRMSTVHRWGNRYLIITKGAPEIVLEYCNRVLYDGKVVSITEDIRKMILNKNDEYAMKGYRVLAIAYKIVDKKPELKEVEKDLVFLGLTAMIDPPRDEVYEAVMKTKQAGIDVIMLTGDHLLTAKTIAKELGVMRENDIAMTGPELEEIPEDKLAEIADKVKVYARINPIQKLKIIRALKKRGHIVAMTGDGVNDAPALKKADIGIAMGIKGTDVAKEASDLILADDNFATIVKAVEGGRRIRIAIRKYLVYLLAANIAEVVTIFMSVLLGLPVAFTVAMILWINLVSDGLPAIALAMDPVYEDVMKRPPPHPKEGLLERHWKYLLIAALVESIICVGVYVATFLAYESIGYNIATLKARTMVFLVIILCELLLVWNCRSEEKYFWELGIRDNPLLLISVLMGILTTFALIYIHPLNVAFGLTPLTLEEITIAILAALPTLLLIQKWFVRKPQARI